MQPNNPSPLQSSREEEQFILGNQQLEMVQGGAIGNDVATELHNIINSPKPENPIPDPAAPRPSVPGPKHPENRLADAGALLPVLKRSYSSPF